MARKDQTDILVKYVRDHVTARNTQSAPRVPLETLRRLEKAFSLLPEDVLKSFLSGERTLMVVIVPNLTIPYGMNTASHGSSKTKKYSITIYEENQDWPEDLFIGAFLRELGHVAAQRPPESEWPQSRGDRARYKEKLEYIADAMVWRWGLRHYSMRHLTATYPEHWVERIVTEIGKLIAQENATN
jgi:hypothetical protein